MNYSEFIANKGVKNLPTGLTGEFWIHPESKPHQAAIVPWALRKGRALIAASPGLGKTLMQLNIAACICAAFPDCMVLIFAPLAVSHQTAFDESPRWGIPCEFVKEQSDCDHPGVFITNYQKIEHFDLSQFKGVLLDEASILKDFTGKFCNLIIDSTKEVPFRFAFSATPSPNDYTELGNYAEFLGICTRLEMLTEYFVHDGETTQEWRLKGHAEEVFWKWLCTWAVALNNPRDMGFDGSEYDLPPIVIHEHIIECDNEVNLAAGVQQCMFPELATTLTEQRAVKRATIDLRLEKARDIIQASGRGGVVWVELNDESDGMTELLDCLEITGSMSDEKKQETLLQFLASDHERMVTKSSIAGHGLNMQKYWQMIFVNVTHSAEKMFQAFARMHRFGQKNIVDVHLILGEQEIPILRNYRRKVADMEKMIQKMVEHMAVFHDVTSTKRQYVKHEANQKVKLPAFFGEKSCPVKTKRKAKTGSSTMAIASKS